MFIAIQTLIVEEKIAEIRVLRRATYRNDQSKLYSIAKKYNDFETPNSDKTIYVPREGRSDNMTATLNIYPTLV
jgi:hypothetical protein